MLPGEISLSEDQKTLTYAATDGSKASGYCGKGIWNFDFTCAYDNLFANSACSPAPYASVEIDGVNCSDWDRQKFI